MTQPNDDDQLGRLPEADPAGEFAPADFEDDRTPAEEIEYEQAAQQARVSKIFIIGILLILIVILIAVAATLV